MNNESGQVYVDLNALADWATSINNLNDDALGILKSFEATLDDLDNYWKGNFATGFINDSTKFTNKAKGIHNSMKDVPVMLKDIMKIKDAS